MKQYFQKADFLQGLFDAIPSFLFIVDEDVRIFHLNAAASKLLDANVPLVLLKRGGEALHCIYSNEVSEGCGHSSHCPDCVMRNAVGKAFMGKSVYRETARLQLREGKNIKEVYMLITASPMTYDGKRFVIMVMEDVTLEKMYEETLRQHAARLEETNRELESFSSSVSHDLKAPVRWIDSFSRILIDEYADKLDPQGRDYLQRVCASSRRMTQLIDDLLDLSRMTREIKREPVDISALAAEVADELRRTHPERAVDFAVRPGLAADADMQLLRIVLDNLLGNAFKFTSGRPEAVIEIGSVMRDGGEAFYVKDNGAGFDMDYADILFTPFKRLHDSKQFPGSGIGLATVKRIIQRHGGCIWAESEVGKGATFYFTLR